MSESKKMDWTEARSFARKTLNRAVASDEDIEKLAQACQSVEQLNLLVKSIYQFSKTHPDPALAIRTLYQHVDDSDYSFTQWIEAYEYFYQWLQERDLSSDFVTMLGYLGCCSLSPENKTHKRELCGLLQEMLQEHGFQAALKRP